MGELMKINLHSLQRETLRDTQGFKLIKRIYYVIHKHIYLHYEKYVFYIRYKNRLNYNGHYCAIFKGKLLTKVGKVNEINYFH